MDEEYLNKPNNSINNEDAPETNVNSEDKTDPAEETESARSEQTQQTEIPETEQETAYRQQPYRQPPFQGDYRQYPPQQPYGSGQYNGSVPPWRNNAEFGAGQNPQYGNPPYGGRPEYADPRYGNPPYGYQPPYGNNHYKDPQPRYAYENPVKTEKNKKSKGKAFFIIAGCFLVIVLIVVLIFSLFNFADQSPSGKISLDNVPTITAATVEADEEGLTGVEVYDKIYKSSVSILAYDQEDGELSILGSGAIIQEDTDGKYSYIVTCAHVISDIGYNLKIELWDGSILSAEIVNYDESNDIGVIRVAKTGLVIAEFGESDALTPGATVYAIGSPYEVKFSGTFTRGMVSAVNRLVTTETKYQLCCIQHDAPINQGNSGGALVNAYGQIVGINALKISANGFEGLGFAVPSKTVIRVINTIIKTGIAPKTAKLGVSYIQAIYNGQFYADLVEKENLPAGSIVVVEINEDSSLYNSELQENDIVVAVNGEPLTTPDILVKLIQDSNVGDPLVLTVKRLVMNEDGSDYTDMKELTVTATLIEKKAVAKEATKEPEEGSTFNFGDYFKNGGDEYEDFFEDFFEDYYNKYYGGSDRNKKADPDDNGDTFSIPGR